MQRTLVPGLVIAALTLVPHPARSQATDPSTALAQRYSEWMNAFYRGDGAAMDKLEADGLMLVFPDATIWTKEQPRVEEFKGRAPWPMTHTVAQVRARVQGDVAVLTGLQNDVNTKDGTKSQSAFTTVWKRTGGDWKVWSAHWSDVPPKK